MAAVGRASAAAHGEEQPLPPRELWQRAEEVYASAQQGGAATKTDTRAEVLRDSTTDPPVDFVLRIVAALRAKPKAPAAAGEQEKAWVNPFLPYEQALWVAHLSPSHTLLLNKFNVVAKHVLVVTRRFESQADPLNANDLAATLQVLRAMPEGGVAFYNCGEHSGRSQPHKHLQVVPLPFEQGQPAAPPVAPLVDAAVAGAAPLAAVELRALPFRAYATRFDDSVTPAALEAAATALLAACSAGVPPGAPVSYNALIWGGRMLMVPRRHECSGTVAINSLGFAGTMLLRSEEDLAYARQSGPMAMLAEVGLLW